MPIPDFENVSVAVTGGAGFIGSHLVDALVGLGARVTVLDDLSTGLEENLSRVRGRVLLLRADIRDREACARAAAGAAVVFHLAARGSVPRSMADPVSTIDVNVGGTTSVFAACRDSGVARVVYASSSSVYGDSPRLPKKEGDEGAPLSPYALSKAIDEQLAELFGRLWSARFIGLRFFNVFGPRQNPVGPYAAVVPRFFAAARRNEAPVIHGDGEQSRDFTFVSDVVKAMLMAAGAPEAAWGRSYNVAPGAATTVNALAREILRTCGTGRAPVHEPPREGDVRHSRADATAARDAFGFEAEVSIEEGIRMTAESYR